MSEEDAPQKLYKDVERVKKNKEQVYYLSHPTYRDFLNVQEKDLAISQTATRETFPVVLHRVLKSLEESDRTDLACWQTHGRSFFIGDKKKFAKEILPKYFRGQKHYASFHRQLNSYGFLRLRRQGPDQNSFYHELFLKGRPELAAYIPRKRQTGNSVRENLDPDTEPNFYMMQPASSQICGRDELPSKCAKLPSSQNVQSAKLSGVEFHFPDTLKTIQSAGTKITGIESTESKETSLDATLTNQPASRQVPGNSLTFDEMVESLFQDNGEPLVDYLNNPEFRNIRLEIREDDYDEDDSENCHDELSVAHSSSSDDSDMARFLIDVDLET